MTLPDDWRAIVRECLAHREDLWPWELNFLGNLLLAKRISQKHQDRLWKIAEQVLGWAA